MMVSTHRRIGTTLGALMCVLVASCGGDGARTFGGAGTGGQISGTGGSTGGAGGALGGTGGERAGTGGAGGSASGGQMGSGGSGSGGSGSGGSGSGGNGSGGSNSGGTHGTGGLTGSGGAGGSAGSSCDTLAAEYQAEMPRAKACTLGLGTTQCQMGVSSALGCGSGCITYVQDASNLNSIKKRWTDAGCAAVLRPCPAISCIAAQPGNCAIPASGTTPQCQNGLLL